MFHWKRWYQSALRRAEFAEGQLDIARKQRDELRRQNSKLAKQLGEARGCIGRNDLLVVGNSPSEVRVYLNGAYVPQARTVEASQHPGELRNVTLSLSAICRFVDVMPEATE